ncbi:serine/threonine-protein kinase Nek6-like [Silene latifolia]|uniref:serine/threonine-protein kinase Nek6-like n=1 Tax=Silene latifolia TaxID=37657 RepID=UPI003D7870FC
MEAENGDLKCKMDDYEVIEEIDSGAFGTSFLVFHKVEQKKYVMKKIRLAKQTEKLKKIAQQEIELISKLNHPYIVEYKDSWLDKENCVCIVRNNCEGGDMAEIIRKTKATMFSEERVCKWMTQLLLAVDYLHSNRILHRDIKCSNIFLTKESDIRLGDIGLAKLVMPDGSSSSVVGTPNYMCPELLANVPYCYKSDIWSLGCCIFEIAARQPAFRASDMNSLINKINRSLISPFPIAYTSTLKQVIKTMLRKSPENRPTAADLLRNTYLQPYVVRCRAASPCHLPVKSPNSKENSPRRLSGGRPNKGKDGREKEARAAVKLVGNFDQCDPISAVVPTNRNCDKSSTSATSEENLETKRVDAVSYLKERCDASETSKCESFASEGLIDLTEANESLIKDTSSLAPEWVDVNIEIGTKKDGSEQHAREVLNVDVKESEEVKPENNMPAVISHDEKCSSLPSVKTTSNEQVPSENGNHETITLKSEKGDNAEVTPSPADLSLLKRTLSAMRGDQGKSGAEVPTHQRADALESLLELCARLLREDKLDDLSGVLRPFGEETVSSRETAIWLTKSLIAAHKSEKEA